MRFMLIVNDTMNQKTIATNMRGVVGDPVLIRARDQYHRGEMWSTEAVEEKGLARGNG